MKKTVTIGIPAHNEQKNIASLLQAISVQEQNSFILKEIIVICDGSTDNTADIVKKIAKKNSLITLIDDGKRLGKSERLNSLYKKFNSDIFIAFDADVTLGDKKVISELVKPFEDNKVGLVGGRVYPLPQKKFVGKILEAQEYFWTFIVKSIKNGNNIHSHTGPMSAGSSAFFKTVKIPEYIFADDHFLYLDAIRKGFIYRATNEARVYKKLPTTISDYLKQSTRFINSAEQIDKHFGELAVQEYMIPYKKKLRAYFLSFIKYPFYMPLAICLATILKFSLGRYKKQISAANIGAWEGVASTK